MPRQQPSDGSRQPNQNSPGFPQPNSPIHTRRQFLVIAGAGAAAATALLARDAIGSAQDRPVLRSFNGATVSKGMQQFRSRPDLRPPQVVIDTPASGSLDGFIVTEVHGGPSQTGPLVFDQTGRIIWFQPLSPKPSAGHRAFNVQVQSYDGKPVLAWFQGAVLDAHGQGFYEIVDTRYRQVAQVHAQGGLQGDLHELILTPQGTALFTAYGQAHGRVRVGRAIKSVRYFYGVVQEVDIATRKLLFQWRSDRHVPLSDSYISPQVSGGVWDYFHINSIAIDPADQNLVISSRNTSAVYKINRKTGNVIWQLGGKRNQFHRGPGANFAFQHDVKLWPGGLMTVFDNEGGPPRFGPQSRALTLAIDEQHRQVRLIRADVHHPELYAIALGSVRPATGGGVFVGWGPSAYFTKYDSHGRVLFDGYLATGGAVAGASSYRAFLQPWNGVPTAPPDIAVVRSKGKATVYASWNGASELAKWMVLGGPSHKQMSPLGTANLAGFETGIALGSSPACIAVSACDAEGRVLGTSKTVTS